MDMEREDAAVREIFGDGDLVDVQHLMRYLERDGDPTTKEAFVYFVELTRALLAAFFRAPVQTCLATDRGVPVVGFHIADMSPRTRTMPVSLVALAMQEAPSVIAQSIVQSDVEERVLQIIAYTALFQEGELTLLGQTCDGALYPIPGGEALREIFRTIEATCAACSSAYNEEVAKA